MEKYEITLPVKVHGWDHEVTVEVEAEDRWEAVNALSGVLTKLVAGPRRTLSEYRDAMQAYREGRGPHPGGR